MPKGEFKMKNIVMQTAAVLALTVSATAMSAQSEMDTDGDGLLSYNELLAVNPELTEEAFGAIDTNSDGAVDADELKAAQEAGLLPA
jgi:Ca2+-binding EF-hand superfamily protein